MARPKGRSIERRRAAKAEAAEKQKRSAHRKRSALIAVAAVGVVGVAVAFVLLQPPAPGVAYPSLGNDHIATIDQPHIPYNSSPPSSGPHTGNLASWGEYDSPLPPELFVHNLEDGGVALTYSCTDCGDLVTGLRSVADRFRGDRLVLFPYDEIVDQDGTPRRAAAVAWGRVFYFDALDEATTDELVSFIKTYEGVDHHVRVATPHGG